MEDLLHMPSAIRQIMKMADERNIRDMGLDPNDVISFGGGWVGHMAPTRLREVYAELCSTDAAFHEAGAYPPTPGLPECRRQLADLDRRLFGMEISEENIVISNSSTQLTHDLFRTIVDPGDAIILLDPTYANYRGQMVLALPQWWHDTGCYSARISFLRTFDPDSWSYMPDIDSVISAMEEIFRREAPRALLVPSPDNPTGQVVPQKFMEAAMDLAQRYDSYIVVDYAYKTQCFLDTDPDYFSWSPEEYDNLVLIYSNSKWSRNLGRRMGWVAASPTVAGALSHYLNYSCLCGDNLHQMAMARYLEEALADGSLTKYLNETREAYRQAAHVTASAIDEFCGLRRLEAQGGLYMMMELGSDADEMVGEIMRNTGVLFVPGSGFGRSTSTGVRVSYGPLVNDRDRIREGFERTGEYLKTQRLVAESSPSRERTPVKDAGSDL